MAGQQPQKTKRRFALSGGQSCVCCLPRRGLLSGFAAVAASAALPACLRSLRRRRSLP